MLMITMDMTFGHQKETTMKLKAIYKNKYQLNDIISDLLFDNGLSPVWTKIDDIEMNLIISIREKLKYVYNDHLC